MISRKTIFNQSMIDDYDFAEGEFNPESTVCLSWNYGFNPSDVRLGKSWHILHLKEFLCLQPKLLKYIVSLYWVLGEGCGII